MQTLRRRKFLFALKIYDIACTFEWLDW